MTTPDQPLTPEIREQVSRQVDQLLEQLAGHEPKRPANAARVVPPLDLVDADGDRIRFAAHTGRTDADSPIEVWLGGHDPEADWSLEAALTLDQLREVLRWAQRVIGVANAAQTIGRPYTDEELAHTPSARRDQILREQLTDPTRPALTDEQRQARS